MSVSEVSLELLVNKTSLRPKTRDGQAAGIAGKLSDEELVTPLNRLRAADSACTLGPIPATRT